MTLDNAVRAFAGTMVLISVALTYFVHPYFVWLTVFIGFNLIQSSFTGICPAAILQKTQSGSCVVTLLMSVGSPSSQPVQLASTTLPRTTLR